MPRARLRGSIHRVDPINTALRRSVALRRRVYHYEGPNAVWHVDGNHKLVRWRFVIHGGIDGFSQTIVFLHCSNNNRASTVLSCFIQATENYGVPTRLFTDLGGENTEIWRFMLEQHPGDMPVITGSSTHNERIERLWRDVTRCVSSMFRDTFQGLEEEGVLDPLNEVDMFCLQYVFKPRINHILKSFVDSWNNHSLSSERSQTPNQLFVCGFLESNTYPQLPAAASDSSVSHPTPRDYVDVPRSTFSPCIPLSTQVSRIDPLDSSNEFGVDLYKRAVDVIGHHLLTGCSNCES